MRRFVCIMLVLLLSAALAPAAFADGADPDEGAFCGQKAHTHTEACYETVHVLICETEESDEHTHTDACYAEQTVLICGQTEHTHSLACYSDRKADVENATIWRSSVSDAQLTGDWAHDLVAVAKTQLGYAASTRNYIVVNGRKKGYTRYGDWYGDSDTFLYGDWCAGFVSFCLHYAGVDLPESFACAAWVRSLTEAGAYRDAKDHAPRPGDLIFFYSGEPADAEKRASTHVGIVVEVKDAELVTVEGNNGPVGFHTYARDDARILGYGMLPENPARAAKPAIEPERQPERMRPLQKRTDRPMLAR